MLIMFLSWCLTLLVVPLFESEVVNLLTFLVTCIKVYGDWCYLLITLVL